MKVAGPLVAAPSGNLAPGVAGGQTDMYTSEGHRGKGIATGVLSELEKMGSRFIL